MFSDDFMIFFQLIVGLSDFHKLVHCNGVAYTKEIKESFFMNLHECKNHDVKYTYYRSQIFYEKAFRF